MNNLENDKYGVSIHEVISHTVGNHIDTLSVYLMGKMGISKTDVIQRATSPTAILDDELNNHIVDFIKENLDVSYCSAPRTIDMVGKTIPFSIRYSRLKEESRLDWLIIKPADEPSGATGSLIERMLRNFDSK